MLKFQRLFWLTFATLASLSAYSSAEIDPQLQDRLEASTMREATTLIADEADRLGVTALTYAIIEGEEDPQTYYTGRAKPQGLMQVASLSKTVAAAVILSLADERGMDIDADIRPQVTSLDIASLEGGDRPVTLRQLLSHTTGSSQSGYPGYARNSDLPTTADVVANPPRTIESPLVFDGEPGKFRYSGGGYMIAQLWAQDVSSKPFSELAKELILEPLGMEESTFTQPIDEAAIAPLTIVGADVSFSPLDGVFTSIEDSWHDYPEQAAAGLWTTSTDYAIFAAALMDAARGAENAIPSAMANEMIAAQAELEEGQAYGLGTQLVFKDDGSLKFVSHSGVNTGYRAWYSARPATPGKPRRVVVSIANTPEGSQLNRAIVYALTDK